MECGVICYLKGCKVCKLCMDEYFLHLFGIITISTTRVDCLFGLGYNIFIANNLYMPTM